MWRKSLWGACVRGISNIPLKKEAESSPGIAPPETHRSDSVCCIEVGIYSDLLHTFVNQKYLASPSYPSERHGNQLESWNKRHGGKLDIVHCFLNPSDLLKHFLGDAFKDYSRSRYQCLESRVAESLSTESGCSLNCIRRPVLPQGGGLRGTFQKPSCASVYSSVIWE